MTWNDYLLELVKTGRYRKQGDLVSALAEQGFPDPYTVSHSSKELHL